MGGLITLDETCARIAPKTLFNPSEKSGSLVSSSLELLFSQIVLFICLSNALLAAKNEAVSSF